MIVFEPVRDASREGVIRTVGRKRQLHILANHHIPSVAPLGINASTNAHVGPVVSTVIAVSVRRPDFRIRTSGLGSNNLDGEMAHRSRCDYGRCGDSVGISNE
jgi:hypothetical protein